MEIFIRPFYFFFFFFFSAVICLLLQKIFLSSVVSFLFLLDSSRKEFLQAKEKFLLCFSFSFIFYFIIFASVSLPFFFFYHFSIALFFIFFCFGFFCLGVTKSAKKKKQFMPFLLPTLLIIFTVQPMIVYQLSVN